MRGGGMTGALTIRPAQPADAQGIAQVLHSVGWFDSFERGSPQTHATNLAPLLVPSERQLQLVACDAQGRVLGYCATHWLPTAILQGWDAYVSELFMHADARGMGVGSQLLQQAVDAAREKGCSRIWLVNNRDRDSYLRSFYAQQGWQEQSQAARFVLTL